MVGLLIAYSLIKWVIFLIHISGEGRETRWWCCSEQVLQRNLPGCRWRHEKSNEQIFCKNYYLFLSLRVCNIWDHWCNFFVKVESHGTVLSTNWKEVGLKKVEGSPPDGMELKKWEYWNVWLNLTCFLFFKILLVIKAAIHLLISFALSISNANIANCSLNTPFRFASYCLHILLRLSRPCSIIRINIQIFIRKHIGQ